MRPINKGFNNATFKPYKKVRNLLAGVIGWYCSYCEMPTKNSLEVEHVIPHSKNGAKHKWQNFLLSCRYCNGVKKNRNANRTLYVWPDQDNTLKAFRYSQANIIEANSRLSPAKQRLANRTIDLFGLNRVPNRLNKPEPTKADTRWESRDTAWELAGRYLIKFRARQCDVETVVDLAKSNGHFSIWMDVFNQETVVKRELVRNFSGTDSNCFDRNLKHISKGRI